MADPRRPLHPSVRQRRNRSTTAAELVVLAPEQRAAVTVPELPPTRLWDVRTSAWWVDVHQSPMALEWDPSDAHALIVTAYLLDEFFRLVDGEKVDHYKLVRLSDQIMKRSVRMGCDPFSRRSLSWLLVATERDEADRDLKKEQTSAARRRRARPGLEALE